MSPPAKVKKMESTRVTSKKRVGRRLPTEASRGMTVMRYPLEIPPWQVTALPWRSMLPDKER